jgi:hypothetical protein
VLDAGTLVYLVILPLCDPLVQPLLTPSCDALDVEDIACTGGRDRECGGCSVEETVGSSKSHSPCFALSLPVRSLSLLVPVWLHALSKSLLLRSPSSHSSLVHAGLSQPRRTVLPPRRCGPWRHKPHLTVLAPRWCMPWTHFLASPTP